MSLGNGHAPSDPFYCALPAQREWEAATDIDGLTISQMRGLEELNMLRKRVKKSKSSEPAGKDLVLLEDELLLPDASLAVSVQADIDADRDITSKRYLGVQQERRRKDAVMPLNPPPPPPLVPRHKKYVNRQKFLDAEAAAGRLGVRRRPRICI